MILFMVTAKFIDVGVWLICPQFSVPSLEYSLFYYFYHVILLESHWFGNFSVINLSEGIQNI